MIRQILEGLPPTLKKQLLIALEAGHSDFIKLKDGYIIGVNLVETAQVEIIETIGDWSYGKLKTG